MKRKLLFSGPCLTASGYGTHARQLLTAIVASDRYDVAVEPIRWGETSVLHDESFDWIRKLAERKHAEPEISIQVTIPNEFKRRAPLSIGVTAGIEVDRVSPQWIVKCNQEVDLVVVPSEHSRASFLVEYQAEDGSKLRLERPIFVVSEGVDTAVYRPGAGSFPGDLAERTFVFTGLGLDKSNGRDRKNLSRLIEYFCKTFAGNQTVGLALKSSIVNNSTIDYETIKRRITEIKNSSGCGEFPRITLIHGRLSEAEMAGLYGDPRVISAVSLTHGEGFGLPLIEAAACGLPIMATDWSGHLDFLTKDGRKLFVPLEYDLQEIPPEAVWEGVMDVGTRWAEVRSADVCNKLRKMALSSDTPRKWAAELAEHVRSRYSLEVTGRAFTDLLGKAADELERVLPKSRDGFVAEQRSLVRAKGPSLIYTMPMSAGDVFLSIGVVSALRKKHPGYRVYFATQSQYFHILRDYPDDAPLPLIDELLPFQEWMLDPELLQDIFDEVYTPNLAIQLVKSNWIHRGNGRKLIDEFAAQCGVEAAEPVLPQVSAGTMAPDRPLVAVHTGGQKSARRYNEWTEVIRNLRENGVKILQVGAADDLSCGEVDMDLRGKTDHGGLVSNLENCWAFLGIDSYPMHVANYLGLKVISLFGSSYPGSTGPKHLIVLSSDREGFESKREKLEQERLHLIETTDRMGCDRACYKDVCRVDADNACINRIPPERVFLEVMGAILPGQEVRYQKHRPKIAGYTHLFNPKTHGYPYIQSIRSMLGFCDEVVVVNGSPKDEDESIDDLRDDDECQLSLLSGQLKIIDREWDFEEPGMDGMQKAFGRAMVSPDVEFLWQQDADEVVHESDYVKIWDMCKRFPPGVDLVHLPVIELWGDDRHVRTDRHSWKWRISRNNLRITHGIAIQARAIDSKTGRVYAKKGQSDGCEMIDIVTGEHLPHRGFYSKELDAVRLSDPPEYAGAMNQVFSKLPSVWHYSWADLPRKVRNFRDFWDRQWQTLYQSPPEPRFPTVISEHDVLQKAEELRVQGGEHGPAHTFEIAREAPTVMRSWK